MSYSLTLNAGAWRKSPDNRARPFWKPWQYRTLLNHDCDTCLHLVHLPSKPPCGCYMDVELTSTSHRRTNPSSPAESRVLFRSTKWTLLIRPLNPVYVCAMSCVCKLKSASIFASLIEGGLYIKKSHSASNGEAISVMPKKEPHVWDYALSLPKHLCLKADDKCSLWMNVPPLYKWICRYCCHLIPKREGHCLAGLMKLKGKQTFSCLHIPELCAAVCWGSDELWRVHCTSKRIFVIDHLLSLSWLILSSHWYCGNLPSRLGVLLWLRQPTVSEHCKQEGNALTCHITRRDCPIVTIVCPNSLSIFRKPQGWMIVLQMARCWSIRRLSGLLHPEEASTKLPGVYDANIDNVCTFAQLKSRSPSLLNLHQCKL